MARVGAIVTGPTASPCVSCKVQGLLTSADARFKLWGRDSWLPPVKNLLMHPRASPPKWRGRFRVRLGQSTGALKNAFASRYAVDRTSYPAAVTPAATAAVSRRTSPVRAVTEGDENAANAENAVCSI